MEERVSRETHRQGRKKREGKLKPHISTITASIQASQTPNQTLSVMAYLCSLPLFSIYHA